MVISENGGNLVIRIADTRIAISKELARKIII
jgi:Fe2+ transport system protein FeoA